MNNKNNNKINILDQIKKKILDLSIRKKFILFYIIVVIISLLISIILFQNLYSNIISKKINSVVYQAQNSIASNIKSVISATNNYSKIILSNDLIQKTLINSNGFSDMETQQSLKHYFLSFLVYSPLILSINLIDEKNNIYSSFKNMDYVTINININKTDWYDTLIRQKGMYILKLNSGGFFKIKEFDESYVSMIRVVNDISSMKPIGILIINIPQREFASTIDFFAKTDINQTMLLDENNKIIAKIENDVTLPIDVLNIDFSNESGYKTIHYKSKKYIVSYLKIEEYDWKIINIFPKENILKDNASFYLVTFIIIFLNGMLIFIGAILISRLITNPINKLIKSMKSIEKGEFIQVKINIGNDEIGKLKNIYNIMIKKIQALIQKIINEQKTMRQIELNALQAQIKPHFLYNTFDAISSLALSEENEKVYTVIKALGSFYKHSLSKGNEVITIGDEISIIKNYLTIQKVRYDNFFSVNYDLDEDLFNKKILKLVLQPFIENAIYHGLRPKESKGTINVKVFKDNDFIKLSIKDDGVGMKKKLINKFYSVNIKSNDNSFGIAKTIERLRIFYNTKNIVSIESNIGAGTKITISIPLEEADKKTYEE